MDYRILIFIIFLIIGCAIDDSKRNIITKEKTSTIDMKTLPIVGSYALITPDNGFSWYYQFNYEGIKGRKEIGNIAEICVKEPYIYLHTDRMYYNSSMTDLWLVIDTQKKEELVFTSIKDIEWLDSEDDLQLFKVKKIHKTYKENGELPWL